jgi:hypothetical protein
MEVTSMVAVHEFSWDSNRSAESKCTLLGLTVSEM